MTNRNDNDQRNSDGLMLPIFAVAAVFLFIILCFYAYNHIKSSKNSGGVVVLEGDSGNFKTTPSDPGGMQVAHTDKEVFNTVTGAKENIDGEKVNVIQTENPVSKEAIATSAESTEAAKPASPVDSAAEGTSTMMIDSSGAAQSAEEETDIAPTADNNVQPNVSLDEGDSVQKTAAPAAAAVVTAPAEKATPAAETKTAKAPAAVKISEKSSKAEEKKSEEKKAEPKKAESKDKAKLVKADVKKETDKKTGDTKTVISFRDPPKSMANKKPVSLSSSTPASESASKASSKSESGSYYVQVSSTSTRSEADDAWKKLTAKYAADIKGSGKNVTEAVVKDKTYYRLSFGPFNDRAAASTKCGMLKTKGQDCIVQKY